MAQKYLDNNGLTYLVQKIKVWDGNKVDKVEGKSLVSDTEIARLASVKNYDDSALKSEIAEKTTMAAVEAKGYQTSDEVSAAIAAAMGEGTGIDFSIVDSLPTTGKKGIIYLVPHQHGTNDSFDEYVWITKTDGTSSFEKFGNTDINLDGYLKDTDLVKMENADIDAAITAASK